MSSFGVIHPIDQELVENLGEEVLLRSSNKVFFEGIWYSVLTKGEDILTTRKRVEVILEIGHAAFIARLGGKEDELVILEKIDDEPR